MLRLEHVLIVKEVNGRGRGVDKPGENCPED